MLICVDEDTIPDGSCAELLKIPDGILVKLPYGNVPVSDPENDPVLIWIELDTVPVGRFARVWVELDTVPAGRFALVWVELDTVPIGNAVITRVLVKYKLVPSVKLVVVAVPK